MALARRATAWARISTGPWMLPSRPEVTRTSSVEPERERCCAMTRFYLKQLHARQTLASFLMDDWLPAVRVRLEPSTLESYQRYLRVHILPTLGSHRLRKLTGQDLNRLYASLLRDGRRDGKPGGLSPRSVRYIHAIVHSALDDAVRWSRIDVNPAGRADPPSASAARSPEMRTWDRHTLSAFLRRSASARDPLHAAWLTLATTGLRRGELLGVRWSDINLETCTLRVRQQVNLVGGAIIRTDRTKCGRPRVLELDCRTVAVLRARLKDDLKDETLTSSESSLVFSRHDGSPLHPGRFSREFDRRVARYQLPRIRLHDLRVRHEAPCIRAG